MASYLSLFLSPRFSTETTSYASVQTLSSDYFIYLL